MRPFTKLSNTLYYYNSVRNSNSRYFTVESKVSEQYI